MSTNPPPPKSSFPSPEEQSGACLTRSRYVVFFFSFFFQILILPLFISGKIFHVSVFFHSEFNFRPSVGCLAAGHRHQTKARFMQMAEEEFLRDRSRPFVHLSISLLTGTLASTFSCAVFNRDVHLDENRKGTNGPLNCRRVHTRKKSHTECVLLVKSGNRMSNDPPVTISHFWHQPTYLMLPCFSVHFYQHLIGQRGTDSKNERKKNLFFFKSLLKGVFLGCIRDRKG